MRGFNSGISASMVVPTHCLGATSRGRLTTRYVRSVSTSFMGGIGRNSVVITRGGFNYNSSHRRTPVTVGTDNVSYMVTSAFTEVFCHGSVGVNLPVLRYSRTTGSVGRNSAISMGFSANIVAGRAANGACRTRPFPRFVRGVVGGNNLVGSVVWSISFSLWLWRGGGQRALGVDLPCFLMVFAYGCHRSFQPLRFKSSRCYHSLCEWPYGRRRKIWGVHFRPT